MRETHLNLWSTSWMTRIWTFDLHHEGTTLKPLADFMSGRLNLRPTPWRNRIWTFHEGAFEPSIHAMEEPHSNLSRRSVWTFDPHHEWTAFEPFMRGHLNLRPTPWRNLNLWPTSWGDNIWTINPHHQPTYPTNTTKNLATEPCNYTIMNEI